eukprot:13676074-Ditylum_brightwellii.AAC.1
MSSHPDHPFHPHSTSSQMLEELRLLKEAMEVAEQMIVEEEQHLAKEKRQEAEEEKKCISEEKEKKHKAQEEEHKQMIEELRLAKEAGSLHENLAETYCDNIGGDPCVAQSSSQLLPLKQSKLRDDKDDSNEDVAIIDSNASLQPNARST